MKIKTVLPDASALIFKADKDVELHWQVPFKDEFTFASIGDSGGNHELSWCLKRSAELGAEFLLHLGDFNYQDGDYERAIDLFHNAPIPCYITIGNHDFHDSGLLHHQFTDYLGPFNSVFSLGNVRFSESRYRRKRLAKIWRKTWPFSSKTHR